MEAISRTGGVVGVTPVPPFLGEDEMHSHLSVLLDHIDHMASVMGEDGVGLGMDFDGVGDKRTEGIDDISKLPNLTRGLVERSHTDEAISKILGGNFLRVLREVLEACIWPCRCKGPYGLGPLESATTLNEVMTGGYQYR